MTTPVSAPVPAPAPPPAPAAPAERGALPVGKGMWIWLPERVEGGDPAAIVAKAKAVGLTHVFVRTGSSKDGFTGGPFLDALLPVAHANGIRVYGWDFTECDNPGDDVNRALTAIRYTTPDGQRIDGFSPDIETPSEGTSGNVEYLSAYAQWLRDNVGDKYPLIATVPNPTAYRLANGFPYAQILGPFDAVAPMVYWMNREPGADVANAISYLAQFGKPIFPIGQAYDGGPEGGPPGVPSREQLQRFMEVADQAGAAGVSFWSWQHADDQAWQAIADSPDFTLGLGGPDGGLTPAMIRSYQTLLTGLGFPIAADGAYGPDTLAAVAAYQRAAHLSVTGRIDESTRALLLTPVAAPLRDPNS
ncbi:MAG TPA: peptidoglycan-binding protein [Acidimicrobiales bacterium]|nr:peptidoglycan-binding protein [Acidimicrobiales bacterium]